MRMLCICAKSDPVGHLIIAGNILDNSDIAKMAGIEKTAADELISELERWGVFSRNGNGQIYSRRMIRDIAKREKMRKNGKMGGNPTLCKQKEKEGLDKVHDMTQWKKPESRVHIEKKINKRKCLPADWKPSDDGFQYASEKGYSTNQITDMAEDFKTYWAEAEGDKALKKNWNQAWTMWVRNDIKFHGPPNMRPGGRPTKNQLVG